VDNSVDVRSYGRVFNEIADEYDRHRPAYPDRLIDRACEVGGLARGARVLEIGCGTGQLTRSLLAQGLRVMAVQPGEQLIARARDQLAADGEVQFLNARLEDPPLPHAYYRAAFSASAIHWVDPDVSWQKVADALVDGGTVALVSYFGLQDSRSAHDQQALRAASHPSWPASGRVTEISMARSRAPRSGTTTYRRRGHGCYGVARQYVSDLFEGFQLAAMPIHGEHTADALNALLGTMSFWARLSPRQRDALVADNHALHQRLGRPIRSSTVACLVTARRASRT
jgi:SAM-dependent methyltransferase